MDSETFLEALFQIALQTEGDEETRKLAFEELLKESNTPEKSSPEQGTLPPSSLRRQKAFSGQKRDASGRVQCYQGGRHIPCAQDRKGGNPKKNPGYASSSKKTSYGGGIQGSSHHQGYDRVKFHNGTSANFFQGHTEHLREQILAHLAYAALDGEQPTGKVMRFRGNRVLVVPLPKQFQTLKEALSSDKNKALALTQQRFVMDCLLRNVSTVGRDFSNILITSTPNALRTVANDALRYSQDGKQVELSSEVEELDSFRDGTYPDLKAVFGTIPEESIPKQIKEILTKQESILRIFPPNLQKTMQQRLEYLKSRIS